MTLKGGKQTQEHIKNKIISRGKKQFCKKGHDTFVVGRDPVSTCKECRRQTCINWSINHPDRVRNNSWKTQGIKNSDGSWFITIDYDRNYQIQQGKCKICGKHQSELKLVLVVDHDHNTGIFRGLLCYGCNRNLSLFENIEIFLKFIDYLGSNGL